MPPSVDEALASLAGQVWIGVGEVAGNPFRFTASLEGFPDKATVTDAIILEQIQNADIDLSLLAKNVRFANPDILDGATVGGMPIASELSVTLDDVTQGPLAPPGVPGWLAALSGTIPLPVQTLVEEELSVKANVRWSIRDEDGAPAPDVYWKVGAGGAGLEGRGGSVAPPIDRALDQLELTFVLVRELTTAAPVAIPETLQVAASLQLIAGGFSSEWIELAPVPLTVPTIPLPSMLAMFGSGNLEGSLFIAAPSDSALSTVQEQVSATVQALNNALTLVSDVLELGDFLLGLGDLTSGIDNAPTGNGRFRVVFRDQIDNFESYVLDEKSWARDETWDNTMSSLVFLGPAGRRVRCCNAPDLESHEGEFELAVVDLLGLVEIKELHDAEPEVDIAQGATFRVTRAPPGDRTWPKRNVYIFGNEMSSLRFE